MPSYEEVIKVISDHESLRPKNDSRYEFEEQRHGTSKSSSPSLPTELYSSASLPSNNNINNIGSPENNRMPGINPLFGMYSEQAVVLDRLEQQVTVFILKTDENV